MGLKPRHIEQNMGQIKKVIFSQNGGITSADKREHIADINPNALFADGFDGAIAGYEANGFCCVYDYDKCMEILMNGQPEGYEGMTKQEAHEYMEFNVISAYVGDFTPIFVHEI